MENLDSDTGTNDIINNICESPVLTEELEEVQEGGENNEIMMDIKEKNEKKCL